MISEMLRAFIAKAETHVVGEPPFGSTRNIILEWLGSTTFLDLEVSASFGMGRASSVPWIGFFGYDQKTQKGIYPVFLYYREQKRLVLAYGISETHKPDHNWSGLEGKQTIREYFSENELGTPAKYGSSLVQSVYDRNDEFDEAEIQNNLEIVVRKFKSVFENEAGSDISQLLNASNTAAISPAPITPTEFGKTKEILFGDEHRTILTAIKTKPFVLLAGLSGTGKSRLVRTLAYMTCFDPKLRVSEAKPGNFELVAVKPNWHDSGELMGYVSRINGEKYVTTAFLRFLAKAWKFPHVPFFLCLDEMNLAPVEQYFAEYLSIIETRASRNERVKSDFLIAKSQFENPELYDQLLSDLGLVGEIGFTDGISIPANFIVVGTVNMDETTHSFSRKVLDRAMTFEMNIVDLNSGLSEVGSDWSYPETFVPSSDVVGNYSGGADVFNRFSESVEVVDYLNRLNMILDGTPFKIAYRVRDEFLMYCHYSSLFADKPDNWLDMVLDEMTAMKVLSRIEGDEPKTGQVLMEFSRILNDNFSKTSAKLDEMQKRLQISGYTSFWS